MSDLRDNGHEAVVREAIGYVFPDARPTAEQLEDLLTVARDAENGGLDVRAMIEQAWRAASVQS